MNQDRAPILRLEDISKSFSGVTVLDGINLNLYGHEVLALMGENGAGIHAYEHPFRQPHARLWEDRGQWE